MLNFYKLIEIVVSLQSLIISTLIPVYIPLPFMDRSSYNFEIPITWQIPTIIVLTLIFERKVVFRAFTIYIFIGLFLSPVFHQGGSLGYMLTPNFCYLLGVYPLIIILDNLNKINKFNTRNFLINGFLAIGTMHLTGILLNFVQLLFYNKLNIFFYNLGKYSFGKIGYHLLMIMPLILIIKPIKYFKYKKR